VVAISSLLSEVINRFLKNFNRESPNYELTEIKPGSGNLGSDPDPEIRFCRFVS